MDFKLHTQETAPADSQPLLENSLKAFGMIPNLHAVMAEAPTALEAYQNLHTLFQNTSFNADELTVVWQSINVEHDCHYCIPAHTGIAHMMKVDNSIIEALRNKTELPSEKLEVLRNTTLAIVRNRGHVDAEDLKAFVAVGYGNQQILEIILGLAQKVMSNYVNHLADTPVDDAFKKFI
ncbi:carboxymuconolactone decarboxylase family protein [Kiloniella antarctica]|uniref:Carboxymuconolactone decarboxylase family protein n=1 Tax=Kiloniella antarctica TaxID=1550907 RepID=A0ABW5BL97_9PROT